MRPHWPPQQSSPPPPPPPPPTYAATATTVTLSALSAGSVATAQSTQPISQVAQPTYTLPTNSNAVPAYGNTVNNPNMINQNAFIPNQLMPQHNLSYSAQVYQPNRFSYPTQAYNMPAMHMSQAVPMFNGMIPNAMYQPNHYATATPWLMPSYPPMPIHEAEQYSSCSNSIKSSRRHKTKKVITRVEHRNMAAQVREESDQSDIQERDEELSDNDNASIKSDETKDDVSITSVIERQE